LTIIVLFSGATGAHGQESAGKEEIQNLEKNPVPLPTLQPHPQYELSAAVDYSWLGRTGFSDNNADSRIAEAKDFHSGISVNKTSSVIWTLVFRLPIR